MLNKTPIIVYEKRPIERRGSKRALPLVEMSLSQRETILSILLSLSGETSNPALGPWQTNDYHTQIKAIISSTGHLLRQTNYKRKNTQ